MTDIRAIDLLPVSYVIRDQWEDMAPVLVTFVRMNSPFYDGQKWAVRRLSYCLNKKGKWVLEPMPSERDGKFYSECRFNSIEQAIEVYNGRRKK